MDNINKKYKNIITSFVLNTVLHHVGMSWIIKTNKHLEYDTDKHNSYWIAGGPRYNISICKNYMEKCLKNLLEMQELTYIISCVQLMHIKNNPPEHGDGSRGVGYTLPLNPIT